MQRESVRLLRGICKARTEASRRLLDDKDIQKLIREVSVNVLNGKVSLTARQKGKLRRHASAVRALALKKTSHKRRLAITNQKGGFLSALLVPAVATLASMLTRL